MKVVVCLKRVIDSSLNLGFGYVDESLVQKGLVYGLNPHDAGALAQAISLKAVNSKTQIILVSIGTMEVENILRDGLALGADEAIRIEDNPFQPYSTYDKAKILARAISLMKADLILTGAKSLDNASGMVGPLMATYLNLPFICSVTVFQFTDEGKYLVGFRNASKGTREKVRCLMPAVLAIESKINNLPYASLGRLIESREAAVRQLSLRDVGISPDELRNNPTRVTRLSFPRPRAKAVPLDSSLPAFYRILALLEGGIAKRRGEIMRGSKEEIIAQLFDLLVKEDIIIPTQGPNLNREKD